MKPIFRQETLEPVFKARCKKTPQGDYINLVGLHTELNQIVSQELLNHFTREDVDKVIETLEKYSNENECRFMTHAIIIKLMRDSIFR